MIASIKYYDLIDQSGIRPSNLYTENINGHIPGLEWTDGNGHTLRIVVTGINTSSFIQKQCSFSYEVHQKASGTDYFLLKDSKVEYINNINIIEVNTGLMIDHTQYQLEEGGYQYPEGFWNTHMRQFDYFVFIVGKNIPQVPVSLFFMVLNRILTLEGLTLGE